MENGKSERLQHEVLVQVNCVGTHSFPGHTYPLVPCCCTSVDHEVLAAIEKKDEKKDEAGTDR